MGILDQVLAAIPQGVNPAKKQRKQERKARQAELERLSLSGLQEAQGVLEQMREEGRLLLPSLFQAMGINAEFDDAGNLVAVGGGISADILRARRERLRGALTEGFVDPALERRILQSGGTRDVLGLGGAQTEGVAGLPFRNLPLAAGFGDLSGASLGPLQFLLGLKNLAVSKELAGAQIAQSQRKTGGSFGRALGTLGGILLGSAAGGLGSAAGGLFGDGGLSTPTSSVKGFITGGGSSGSLPLPFL